jgi:hypothetical protein
MNIESLKISSHPDNKILLILYLNQNVELTIQNN